MVHTLYMYMNMQDHRLAAMDAYRIYYDIPLMIDMYAPMQRMHLLCNFLHRFEDLDKIVHRILDAAPELTWPGPYPEQYFLLSIICDSQKTSCCVADL